MLSVQMEKNVKPFYAWQKPKYFLDDVDIVDFYKVDSLLIRQIQDSEGKIIDSSVWRQRICNIFQ